MSHEAGADTDLVRACLRQPVVAHPGVVHAPGRAGAARIPGRPGHGLHPRPPSATAPLGGRAHAAAGPPLRRRRRHPLLRHRGARSTPSASGSTSNRAGARWWRARSARPTTWRACARSSPRRTCPTCSRRCELVASELAGTGTALIGFAGAPFTVASYLIEGGPVPHLHQGQVPHARRPGAVGPADGPAGRHGRSPSCGPRSRPASRPSSSSTAGPARSRPPSTSASSCPPPEPCSTGIADLGVPTILFGVGTGELLGLMGTAGSDVVGVDWRVPLDEARRRIGPSRAVQGNLDPALCVGPVARGRSGHPARCWPRGRRAARATSSTSATASCPRPTPGSWPPWSTWCTPRAPPDER